VTAIPSCPFEFFDENPSENSSAYFMRYAFNEALKAWEKGEIPIGAVAVIDEKLVARAHNAVETNHDPTAHAEMQLIRELSQKKGDWRLTDVTLYVTKEPCPMCAGAIYKARIPKVVIGVVDDKQGCLGGCLCLHTMLRLYHRVSVEVEPLEDACERMLKTFFELRRQQS
jgi:tRNA(adenine34) deaminase